MKHIKIFKSKLTVTEVCEILLKAILSIILTVIASIGLAIVLLVLAVGTDFVHLSGSQITVIVYIFAAVTLTFFLWYFYKHKKEK